MNNMKRKADHHQRDSRKHAKFARTLIGKPSQSVKNIAAQLMDISDHLSRNGYATVCQYIDVTKPEPTRLDIDFEQVASYHPPDPVPVPVPVPAPAPRRGGRRNPNPDPAAAPDPTPAPQAPQITALQQAEMNAYVSQKMKRGAEHIVKLNDLKLELVSTGCMTKEFLNVFIEKVPNHNQLPVRALANRIVKVYDDLVSKDSYKARKDANDEFNKLKTKEVETVQELHARFRNSLWNRGSKYTTENAVTEEEAARKYIDALNSKFRSMKSQLAANQNHDRGFLDAYPTFDYPKSLHEARDRVEAEESRMDSENPVQPGKYRTYPTLDADSGRNPNWRYQPQAILPDKLDPNQKFEKSNGSVVLGRRLTGEDKPSEFGYMFCPDCRKDGFKNNHFKYFHKEFMEKVVGRRGGGKNPPKTINAVLTKGDLKSFGKEIVEGITKAINK